MHNELLTTAEAAQRLGVTPSTVSRMVDRDELKPAVKAPGLRGPMFFAPEAIAAVIAARTEASKAADA